MCITLPGAPLTLCCTLPCGTPCCRMPACWLPMWRRSRRQHTCRMLCGGSSASRRCVRAASGTSACLGWPAWGLQAGWTACRACGSSCNCKPVLAPMHACRPASGRCRSSCRQPRRRPTRARLAARTCPPLVHHPRPAMPHQQAALTQLRGSCWGQRIVSSLWLARQAATPSRQSGPAAPPCQTRKMPTWAATAGRVMAALAAVGVSGCQPRGSGMPSARSF